MKKLACLSLLIFLTSCDKESPTIPNIINILTNTNTTGQNPTASPSPSTGDLPPGSRLAILMFGVTGPSGCTKTDARTIKNGCTGNITCTPKDANGIDLPEAVHGPNAAWAAVAGSERVTLSRTENQFNIDVKANQVGTFTLQCSVKNLTASVDFNIVQ